ncbi:hypothetical protein BS78_06G156900 [Paspalum vaginatum]|nr:hypothetical protein BS78_06G156900 [Paspalum vaginatum]
MTMPTAGAPRSYRNTRPLARVQPRRPDPHVVAGRLAAPLRSTRRFRPGSGSRCGEAWPTLRRIHSTPRATNDTPASSTPTVVAAGPRCSSCSGVAASQAIYRELRPRPRRGDLVRCG